MKKDWFSIFIIIIFGLALFSSLLFIPSMHVSAQIFNCTVRRDVEIPYQFEYFKTRILANAAFEIKFTIRDNSNEKVYVRLIPGAPDPNDPAITIDEKTLTFLLGSGLYSSTKTDYERIGSAEDDYEIPGLTELFFQAAVLDQDWAYDFDGGEARITDITISSDQARIKYLEFWDNEFRDANMHEDSQDFENFNDLDDAEWENLTPNTGKPTILNNEDVLYLTTSIPAYYPPIYYPPYYGSLYTNYPSTPINVYNYYYGNYPDYYSSGLYSYPSRSFASFRGNLPSSFYQGYSSLYPGSYTGSFQSLILGGYPGTYYGYGTYPFSNPAGGFNGYPYSFLSLGSSRNTYGIGYPLYGGFIY